LRKKKEKERNAEKEKKKGRKKEGNPFANFRPESPRMKILFARRNDQHVLWVISRATQKDRGGIWKGGEGRGYRFRVGRHVSNTPPLIGFDMYCAVFCLLSTRGNRKKECSWRERKKKRGGGKKRGRGKGARNKSQSDALIMLHRMSPLRLSAYLFFLSSFTASGGKGRGGSKKGEKRKKERGTKPAN